jgi:PEP-CTERM motif-containing protein
MRFPPLAGRVSLVALAACLAAAAGPARAAYTVTFSELGPDVVARGSGTIDLGGLTFITSGFTTPEIAPTFATEATGTAGAVDEYNGASGPSPPIGWGPGVFTSATMGTGDLVGIQKLIGEPGFVFVPMGYASGAPLSDMATYAGQSFATLGLTHGVYPYTFGSGATADTFTVDVTAPVPEPASLTLLGTVVGLALVARRRRKAA